MTIMNNDPKQPTQFDTPEGVPALTTFYYYLTAGCNLACQHCWITPTFQKNGGTGGHLDFGLFRQSIEEGIPLGLKNAKLTGGEPLLHPQIEEILTHLHAKQLGINIETNGTLMTPKLAQLMRDTNVGFISISLDGAKASTHDPFRGVVGSFDGAVQGIQYLVEVGYHPQVIMSIHESNVNEIEALVRLAEKLGAGSVKFNLIQPTGRAAKMGDEILTMSRLIEIGNWIEKEFYKEVSIPLHYSWPMAFWSMHRLANEPTSSCAIHNILGVLATGHYAMCGIGVNVPELVYGHIEQKNLREIWSDHPVLQQIRSDVPVAFEGICGNCVAKETCLGYCVAENYFLTRSIKKPYWMCQQANEAGLFPASRKVNHEI
jgi:SynChlorMet cassette radical SAM/SPASM protein ScmF